MPNPLPSANSRTAFFDNAKLALIFLVVLGHLIGPLQSTENHPALRTLYTFIYLFHMPCFIFLNGFFARTKNAFEKLMGFLFLYFTCQAVFYLLRGILGFSISIEPFKPQTGLWYLLAMAIFFLLLPIADRIKPCILLPLSFAMGLWAGLWAGAGTFLSLSRIFVFFPFFLLGYYCTQEQLFKLKKKSFVAISLVVMLGILILCRIVAPPLPAEQIKFLYGASPYSAFELGLEGLFFRAGWYLLALLMMTAFLICIPTRQFCFSGLGQYTLGVYVFHLMYVIVERTFGITEFLYLQLGGWIFLPYAFLITFLFSLPLFSRPLRMVFESDLRWLLPPPPWGSSSWVSLRLAS